MKLTEELTLVCDNFLVMTFKRRDVRRQREWVLMYSPSRMTSRKSKTYVSRMDESEGLTRLNRTGMKAKGLGKAEILEKEKKCDTQI